MKQKTNSAVLTDADGDHTTESEDAEDGAIDVVFLNEMEKILGADQLNESDQENHAKKEKNDEMLYVIKNHIDKKFDFSPFSKKSKI